MEKKTLKRLVASSLALACLATAGIAAVATNGFGYYAPEENVQAELPKAAGDMTFEEGKSNGIKLMNAVIAAADYDEYGVSPLAETAYQLTATINPSNATNQKVTWSVAWQDEESDWAEDKDVNDYVTVTPISDGALTASVALMNGFGEKVVVTVTSQDNPDAKATCIVDYASRVREKFYMYTDVTNSSVIADTSGVVIGKVTLNMDISHELSIADKNLNLYYDYTVKDTFSESHTVSVNEAVLAEFNTATGLNATAGSVTDSNVKFLELLGGVDWDNSTNYNKLVEWLTDNSTKSLFTLEVTDTGTYSTFEQEVAIYFNVSGLAVRVESVTLDQGSLIF